MKYHIAVIGVVAESSPKQNTKLKVIHRATLHGHHIIIAANLSPVHNHTKRTLQHHVEPYSCSTAVTLHKRMGNIHLHILGNYFLKRTFGHSFDSFKSRNKIERIGKAETSFRYIESAYLPCKSI